MLLPKLKKMLRDSRGFTMIELLVVIAVIGVLAVAVLSAINPIEQVNKGRDTRSRADAQQLLTAIERYYTNAETFPWNEAKYTPEADTLPTVGFPNGAGNPSVATTVCDPAANGLCLMNSGQYTNNWLEGLEASEEVKTSYLTRITGAGDDTTSEVGDLYVYKGQSSTVTNYQLFVCYYPQSVAGQQQALDECATNKTDYPTNACVQASYTSSTVYGAGAFNEMICMQ